MTAANHALNLDTDPILDLLRADVRGGHACIATFEGAEGTSWMEIAGPRGTRPHGDWLVAPVPTLRLWVPGQLSAPVAVATADRDFDAGLRAIEDEARPHLHPPELAWLSAILRVVRETATGRRPRVPAVGERIVTEGRPLLRGWASCLTLADLEAAVLKAVA